MAERTPENAELAVDELRRKGRRRLVGAIVLALAAAVIVPLLLEKEPRPLGDDVSVQIPPVDEGKFVNRLTDNSGDAKSAAKGPAQPEAKPAIVEPKPETREPVAATPAESAPAVAAPPAKKSLADAEQRVLSPTAKAPGSGDANPPAAPVAATKAPAPDTKAPAPKVDAKPATVPSAAKAEGFVVQLAAFADDKGANALANKLKRAGYPAYVEPVQTSRGTLWRVRVGGYPTRTEADAARAKLKGEGHSGIVAAAK